MRMLILAAVLVAGCDKGRDRTTPAEPTSTGSVVLDVGTASSDVYLATQSEIMRSESLLQRVRDRRRVELDARAVSTRRKSGTSIIEVSVHDKDPFRAAELCNAVIEAYIELRLEQNLTPMLAQQEVLAAELAKHPDDTQLQNRLKELDLARRMPTTDARVLDRCRVPATPKR